MKTISACVLRHSQLRGRARGYPIPLAEGKADSQFLNHWLLLILSTRVSVYLQAILHLKRGNPMQTRVMSGHMRLCRGIGKKRGRTSIPSP